MGVRLRNLATRIRETSGPDTLEIGAWADGEGLIRQGASSAAGFLMMRKLSTTTGIDAKVVATTNLYTGAAGKTTIPLIAIVRVTAASAITIAARAGIGVAAGENDVFAEADMTNLLTTADSYAFVIGGRFAPVAAASIVKLGIDVAATGTSQTLAVDLWGYDF